MKHTITLNNAKHNDIVNRVLNGETYESIGGSWGITREAVRKIASFYNIKSLSYNDKPLTETEQDILNILVENPTLTYTQLTEKYNIPNYDLKRVAKKTNTEWMRHSIYKRGIQPWDYDIDQTTGCWNWKYIHKATGYGRLRVKNKIEYAHRYVYQEIFGEIKPNEVVTQICNNRACVNPDHLKICIYNRTKALL